MRTKLQTPTLSIRWMIRRDMADLLEIASHGRCGVETEDEFLGHLRQRNAIGMVAECRERIVGFMIYHLHAKHIQIAAFGVDHKLRRHGIGLEMLCKLASKLSGHKRSRIVVDVPESQLEAQLFFKACEFQATGVERNVYADEDAYRFVWRVDGDYEVAAPVNRVACFLEE